MGFFGGLLLKGFKRSGYSSRRSCKIGRYYRYERNGFRYAAQADILPFGCVALGVITGKSVADFTTHGRKSR